MSGQDDSFFAPARGTRHGAGGQRQTQSREPPGAPPRPNLWSRVARATSDEASIEASDMSAAEATFFGAARHRQPVQHNLSAALDGSPSELRMMDDMSGGPLTPEARAQLERYRQQVRTERRPDFASSVDDSFEEMYSAQLEPTRMQPHPDQLGANRGVAIHADEDEAHAHAHAIESDPDADMSYPETDASSAIFDPDNDPNGFAARLDELAGVLEIGEAEARAIRWGPAVGRPHADLPIDDFHALISHHLAETEWRFDANALPGAGKLDRVARGAVQSDTEHHPIRVLGRSWAGQAAGERMGPVTAERLTLLQSGIGAYAR